MLSTKIDFATDEYADDGIENPHRNKTQQLDERAKVYHIDKSETACKRKD